MSGWIARLAAKRGDERRAEARLALQEGALGHLAGFVDVIAAGPGDRTRAAQSLTALLEEVPAQDAAAAFRATGVAAVLVPLLEAPNTGLALAVLSLLGHTGDPAVVPALVARGRRDAYFADYAGDSVARIVAFSGAASALVPLAAAPDALTRRIALRGLAAAPPSPGGANAADLVVGGLQDGDAGVRVRSLRAMAGLEANPERIALVRARLEADDATEVREAAAGVFAQLAGSTGDVLLVRMLADREPRVARAAAEALAARARTDGPAVALAILRRLVRGDAPPGVAAILATFDGALAEVTLDALVLMSFLDGDAARRSAAGEALGHRLSDRAAGDRTGAWATSEACAWPVAAQAAFLRWLYHNAVSWPRTAADLVRVGRFALEGDVTIQAPARALLWRGLRGAGLRTRQAAFVALGALPGGDGLLVQAIVELGPEAGASAREALAFRRGVDAADRDRWATLVDGDGHARVLQTGTTGEKVAAAGVLGAFIVRDARPALEDALRDEPAVRAAAARALGAIADPRSEVPLLGALADTTQDAHEARAAILSALGALGGMRTLQALLRVPVPEPNEWAVAEAVVPVARRLGSAARAEVLATAREGPRLRTVLRALGAAAGESGVPALAEEIGTHPAEVVAGLAATLAPSALPYVMSTVDRFWQGDGNSAAEVLHACAAALGELVGSRSEALDADLLARVASIPDRVVLVGAQGHVNRVPVYFFEAREAAGAGLARRGLPAPIADGLRPIPVATLEEIEDTADATRPRPARLAGSDRCAECGAALAPMVRKPGAWLMRCPGGHEARLGAIYAALAFEPPPPDSAFAEVYERWTGQPLPFVVPARARTVSLERREGRWLEIEIGTPEGDFAFRELDEGLSLRPFELKPERYGLFRLGFYSRGMTSFFRVSDFGPDRTIHLSCIFGGVYAEPETIARQAQDVAELARTYATLVARLGVELVHVHAVDNLGARSFVSRRRDGTVVEEQRNGPSGGRPPVRGR